jgi:hypothetical protein
MSFKLKEKSVTHYKGSGDRAEWDAQKDMIILQRAAHPTSSFRCEPSLQKKHSGGKGNCRDVAAPSP